MRAIFNDDPDAKVFIHVGHSHVAERPIPDENGMRWMAARLKEATGIDPLTISLTDCVASGDAPVLASAGVRPDGTLRPVYTDDVVGLPRVTIRDGRRVSVADAYLTPEVLGRGNLTLITGCEVEYMVFEGARATGGEPFAGRRLRAWAHAAGLEVEFAGSSAWTSDRSSPVPAWPAPRSASVRRAWCATS